MSESLNQEINHFPVWTFESRILQNEWANTNVAVIFSYMLARYRFHNNAERKYFESFEVIAKNTGVSVRTAKNAIKVLKENAHLSITKKKSIHSLSNVYVVNDIYGTWQVKKQQKSSSTKAPMHNPNYGNQSPQRRPPSYYAELSDKTEKEKWQRNRDLEELEEPF